MKRITALVLSILMLLGLAGCGGKTNLPAFSAEALTEAQSYAYAAIHPFEIEKNLSLLSAEVLLTEDVNQAIPGGIITEDWAEVQDTRAIVLAKYGNESTLEDDADLPSEAGAEESPSDAGGSEFGGEPALTVAFFLDADENVLAKLLVTAGSGSGYDSAAASPVSEEFLDLQAATPDALRRSLAQAELNAEAFLEENAGQEALAAFAPKAQAVEQTPEGLSAESLLRATGNNRVCLQYWEQLWDCAVLREQVSRMEEIDQLNNSEQFPEMFAAQSLLASDMDIWTQQVDLLKEYTNTTAQITNYEAEHAADIKPIQDAQANFAAAEDGGGWWDDNAYLKLCLQSDLLNQYDILLRQQRLFVTSLAMLRDALQEPDLELREYMAEKNNAEASAFSDYSNAIKVYATCVKNQEAFLADHASELSAYEAAEAAAREAAGAQYKNDISYIKVQLTYEDLIAQRDAHESAVKESKAAADEIRTGLDEELAGIDADEAERQAAIRVDQIQEALQAYLLEEHESVSEYEAEANQWGVLHPDFIAYQNEHLSYIVHTSYSGGGSSSSSGSGGMSYDPNDEYYSSHDYDGDGKLTDEEFQDAFNDYVDDIMGSSSYSSSSSGGMSYDPNDSYYSSHDYDGDGELTDQEFQDAFNDYIDDIMGG